MFGLVSLVMLERFGWVYLSARPALWQSLRAGGGSSKVLSALLPSRADLVTTYTALLVERYCVRDDINYA